MCDDRCLVWLQSSESSAKRREAMEMGNCCIVRNWKAVHQVMVPLEPPWKYVSIDTSHAPIRRPWDRQDYFDVEHTLQLKKTRWRHGFEFYSILGAQGSQNPALSALSNNSRLSWRSRCGEFSKSGFLSALKKITSFVGLSTSRGYKRGELFSLFLSQLANF